MPKLAIFDHNLSAAGGERFLEGLVTSLINLPDFSDWELVLVIPRHNSYGYPITWTDDIKSKNFRVSYMRDDPVRRFFDYLTNAPRVLNIPGSSRIQQKISKFLRENGPQPVREIAGDIRLWIEKFCQSEKPDLAYFSWPYRIDCPNIDCPIVITPHDFNFKRSTTLSSDDRARVERQMPQWLNSCQAACVSSEFMASELRHFYPEYGNKATVIRLGVIRAKSTATDEAVQQTLTKYKLPDKFLVSASWILPHKNQRVISNAQKLLKDKGKSIPIVYVGPNTYQLSPENTGFVDTGISDFLSVANSLNLKANVDYFGLGYVSDLELDCLYKKAQAAIAPSLYEAGSFTSQEALTMECPAILSATEPHLEEVELFGGNAWTFKPDSAEDLAKVIEEITCDQVNAKAKARKAASFVLENFDWKKTARGYFSVFKKVLTG